MRSIVQRVVAASTAEVEVAGIRWRVRALNSALVSGHRLHLLSVAVPTEEQLVEEEAVRTMPLEEQPAAMARLAARRAHAVDLEQMQDAYRRECDMVVAGVTHAFNEETEAWEPLRIVDGMSTAEAVGVEDMAPGTVQELAGAIWSLSTDGGRAAERLRGFRRGP